MLDNYYTRGCRTKKTSELGSSASASLLMNKSAQISSKIPKYPQTSISELYSNRINPIHKITATGTQTQRGQPGTSLNKSESMRQTLQQPKMVAAIPSTKSKSSLKKQPSPQVTTKNRIDGRQTSPRDLKLKFLESSLFGRSQDQYKSFHFASIREQEKHINNLNYDISEVPQNLDVQLLKQQLRSSGIHVSKLDIQFSPTPTYNKSQGRLAVRSFVEPNSKSCSPDLVLLKSKLENLGLKVKESLECNKRQKVWNSEKTLTQRFKQRY